MAEYDEFWILTIRFHLIPSAEARILIIDLTYLC